MQALIPLSQTEIGGDRIETVSARDLHAFLEVGRDFSNWIKDRVAAYNFVENQDFVVFAGIGGNEGRPRTEYAITLDMAKELSMVERNEKGKQARQYFIECERLAKQPRELDDPKALRGLLLSYTERVIELEEKLEEARPVIEFHDRFINADGLYGLQNAGRALGCRPNLFIRWLRREGYLFHQGDVLMPYVRHSQRGLFEVKSHLVDGDRVHPQTYVTPRGLEFFSSRIPDDLKASAA